jgi:predicted DNA-binding transcriptional regulator AlpA
MSEQLTSGDPRPFLTKAEVASRLCLSTRQVDRLIAAGRFPSGLRVSVRPKWRPETVEAYLRSLGPG